MTAPDAVDGSHPTASQCAKVVVFMNHCVGDTRALTEKTPGSRLDRVRKELCRGPVVHVSPVDRDLLLLADAPLDQGDGDAIVAGRLDRRDDVWVAEGQGEAAHLYRVLVGIDGERGVDGQNQLQFDGLTVLCLHRTDVKKR
jgi:hypothetical protein